MVPKRFQRFIILLLVVIGIIYFTTSSSTTSIKNFGYPTPKQATESQKSPSGSSQGSTTETKEQKAYNWVFDLINNNKPSIQPLINYKDDIKAKEKFATDTDFVFSKSYLSNLLQVDDISYRRLKETHTSYVNDIKEDKHKHFSSELSTPSGDGIVFVGGIKFSWLALIGIEQLRLLGCKLPVEVFIGDESEYEEDFCENILPKHNARCSLLYEEVGDLSTKLDSKISGYQFKNLAFLISKFQRILFLDADNVPLRDPTSLFTSKVFNDNGLVIWPDAWARTTHPIYYDIASLNVTDKVVRGPYKGSTAKLDLSTDVTYHDFENTLSNPSSESGMILIDKTKHAKTLLLSLYYNIFGPKLYYALFSQGSAGEGDKETFIAAATVLKGKFYQVLQPFRFIGYHYDNKFNSKALGQADPIVDYQNYLSGSHLDENNGLVESATAKRPGVQFMHLSYPKLIPFALLNDQEIIKPDGHIRMYLSITEEAGYDFELRIFQFVTGALCKDYSGPTEISERLVGLRLKEYFSQDPDTFCPQLIEHTKFLQENPE